MENRRKIRNMLTSSALSVIAVSRLVGDFSPAGISEMPHMGSDPFGEDGCAGGIKL